ncbi:amidohydrolase [Streptomyces noursei]|uniref:Hippurate hydrolase n=1 Tax=Streptomyces noursei TaxID=1971 RepID=A0A059W2Z7_STRNR|nr:amidohydrolase [Streptomyces noursei]AKA04380.1 amidohydrolase [Streptomyces noursei ZPM]AIA04145.1 hippurate hydrolase [Streptomyces noursei]EOT03387.1 amidohydrolase [Streptomyces noursei CCRC 11814]EXU90725.1 amidohydrolase [Streptomyces noursei PD-1]UWS72765.1 amidohydrolase [Streptomyces noursei]
MSDRDPSSPASVLEPLDARLADLVALYEDLHRHPELAYEETRTAAEAARRLTAYGYDVTTGIGVTGVTGVLRNGPGPVVLLRADMDALPVSENSDVPYASTVPGRMHACGHDVHVTCLLGAADLLAAGRDRWSGTLVVLFQPAEEAGSGARAMLDDGLYSKQLVPVPDVVLAQHVAPFGAGLIAYCPGACMAAADSLEITFHGTGGHGSRPETTVDPILMAAAFVQRVQSVVAREIAAKEQVVVTVGSFHAGDTANVIPDRAVVRLSVRSFDANVRTAVLAAVERIARAEAAASGASEEPETTMLDSFPVTVNDDAVLAAVNADFTRHFGDQRVLAFDPATGSEDAGLLATAAEAPLYYWWLGGWDPDAFRTALAAGRLAQDIPSNHSPRFVPVTRPTLSTGVQALTVAALGQLGRA